MAATKPSPKDVDNALFRRTSSQIQGLNRQSRRELRNKQRLQYKETFLNDQPK